NSTGRPATLSCRGGPMRRAIRAVANTASRLLRATYSTSVACFVQPIAWYNPDMRGVQLSSLQCSIARTLDVVGERWSLLVLRDAFNGVRRFEDFATSLPIATNVLTARLQTLVGHGILQRERYQEHPPRYEYRLTEKGRKLYPV